MDKITDAKGRIIGLRTLTVLEQYRLLKAIGAEAAAVEQCVNIAQVAMMAAEIDGVPVVMPRTEQQIEAVIGRLGEEGFAALSVHMLARVAEVQKAAEDAAVSSGPLAPPAS